MSPRLLKKAISGLIALCVILSVLIVKPVEVSADAGIQLGQIYNVSEDDYCYEDGERIVSFSFVPEESGYYVCESSLSMNFEVFEDDRFTWIDDDEYDVKPIDLDYFIGIDAFRKTAYLEAGKAYRLINYYSEYVINYGSFCLRKIDNYIEFKATTTEQNVTVIKDKTFTCSVDASFNVPYDENSVLYVWRITKGDHEVEIVGDSEITLNSNDYFDFTDDFIEGSNNGYSILCRVIANTDSDGFYCFVDFDVVLYTSSLSSETWAEYINTDVYSLDYPDPIRDWENSDYKFEVDAGSSVGCSISYQWYEVDLEKESTGITSNEEFYKLITGANENYFDPGERVNNPYYVFYNGHLSIKEKYVCVVTFSLGDESIQKEVDFEIEYHNRVYRTDDDDEHRVYVNKGESISMPKIGSVYVSEMPEGITTNFYWVNLYEEPKYYDITTYYYSEPQPVLSNLGEDYDYKLLSSDGLDVIIDTSKLTWITDDGKTVAYIALAYEAVYNDIPCLMNSGYFCYKLIDISSLSLEDAVWARSDSDQRMTMYNHSYSDEFVVDAGCLFDCDISYQWYKVDSDKEKKGDFTNREELFIPLEGMNSYYFKLDENNDLISLLGTPYVKCNENNEVTLYTDIVCIVTFKYGNLIVKKEIPFEIDYGSYSVCIGNRYAYVKSGDSVLMPDSCAPYEGYDNTCFEEVSCVPGISYKYTWIGLNSLGDYGFNSYYGDSCSSINSIWDRINFDYSVIGTGISASIDTATLTKFDYSEDKYSFVACVYEPLLNGNIVAGECFESGYYVFKLVYTDLVVPDTTGIAVNSTNFPDDKLRAYVATKVDQNNSGYLSDAEINSVYSVNLYNLGVSNLTGLQYFKNIYYLNCAGNNLTTLDLSSFVNLETLNCSKNKITSLNLPDTLNLYGLYCNDNNIKSLDLSACSNLDFLDCSNNGMTSLVLPSNSNLFYLKMNGNNIGTVDFGNCENLKWYYNYSPCYKFESGVSIYGYLDRESYVYGEDIELDVGIKMDDSTTILNATASSLNGSFFDLDVSMNTDGIKLQWNPVQGATSYEIYKIPYKNGTAYYDTVYDLSYIDNNVTEGTEYTYIVLAYDKNYNLISLSKRTKVTYSAEEEPIKITQQPEDYLGLEGTTAKFTVVAEGNDLTYQWQLKKGSTWANLTSGGATTDTMTIKADKSKDGKIYRCFITDADGNTTTTDEVSITIKEPSIVITSQPESYTGIVGNTAKFTVAAEGEGLTYQWQLKKGKSWADLTSGGATTTTLSIKVDAAKDGKVYRCLITDENGEQLATDEVTITVTEPSIKINSQPVSYSGVVGSTAKFTVAAEGEGLTYQWQLKKGSSWSNLSSGGATTPTLSIKVDASKNGKVYRCLISGGNNEQITSNEVTITVTEPTNAIVINTQPSNYVGLEGSTAKFTVAAEGVGLTYQWQLKKGSSWANLSSGGATTTTLSVKADASKNGKIYRCLITDADGNELASEGASITIKEPSIFIDTQPEDYSGAVGTTAKFTVEARGEGLTYQWQLKKGSKWADLTSGGATTDTLSIKVDSGKDGKVYRCLITDANGEELASEEVTIHVTVQPVPSTASSEPAPKSAEAVDTVDAVEESVAAPEAPAEAPVEVPSQAPAEDTSGVPSKTLENEVIK